MISLSFPIFRLARPAALVLLFLVAGAPLLAQTPAPLQDSASSAIFAFCLFDGTGLPTEHRQLPQTLAFALLEQFRSAPSHSMNSDELALVQKNLLNSAVIEQERLLDKALLDQGDSLFKPGITFDAAASETAIRTIKERLRELELLRPQDFAVVTKKTLVLHATNQKGTLLDVVRTSPLDVSKAQNVDYLVFGSVSLTGAGFLRFQVRMYSRFANAVIFRADLVLPPGFADQAAGDLSTRLGQALIGRPYASLAITAQPATSIFLLDDEIIGSGKVDLSFAEPGSRLLSVKAPGHETITTQVELVAGQRKELTFSLLPLGATTVTIETQPEGAMVHVGSAGATQSPAELPWQGLPQMGLAQAEGHNPVYFEVRSPEGVLVRLPSNLIDWNVRLEQKRDGFYNALGLFLLSIPLPLMSYGLYEAEILGYQQMLNGGFALNVAEFTELQARGRLFFYGYYGGLFISSALFINVLYSLADYISAGEEARRHPGKPPAAATPEAPRVEELGAETQSPAGLENPDS